MPSKMSNGELGYHQRYDGPLVPPPFSDSMNDAFRSFGQPPPNFGSLDDLMREAGNAGGPSARTSASHYTTTSASRNIAPAPHWRSQERNSASSASSASSSSMQRGAARHVAISPYDQEPPVPMGAPEVRAQDLSTADKFVISIDVQGYQPEEIKVKTVDSAVVVEGRHEESRPGGQRYVSRNFSRSWTIPPDVEPEAISSKLSGNGTLTVEAPRRALPPPNRNHQAPAYRSFGQPPLNFGSLDDLMREAGNAGGPGARTSASHYTTTSASRNIAPAPHWRSQERNSASSASSASSSSMQRGASRHVAIPPYNQEPPIPIGAPEVRAQDHSTADKFVISIDVHDYQPEEIKVKTVDSAVVVEGRHEESRPGGQRYVSRNFSRSWTIPPDVEPETITSKLGIFELSGNGTLTVEAPRRALPPPSRQQQIPVQHQSSRSQRYF